VRVIAESIVDWGTLGEVIVASIAAGVGATVCFAFAVLGATRFADMRRAERPLGATFFAALGLLGFAATVAAVVLAIVVMTTKS
jgi:hypothetical protein